MLLRKKGYIILEKNFRCPFGEIDIIAHKDNTFVFVEVKYRTASVSGYAQEAVSLQKQRTISKAADYYRMIHDLPDGNGFRFDVIAVNGAVIQHFENAFPYRGRF